jgi:hypothetical protein
MPRPADDAAAAERAFSSLGSLGDILHAALTHPFGRIGSGRSGPPTAAA